MTAKLNLLFDWLQNARDFRRLRKKLPYVYRRFVHTPVGVRQETNYEYLSRLRHEHEQRSRSRRQGVAF